MWSNDEKLYTNALTRVKNSILKTEDKNMIFLLVNKLIATKIGQRRAVKYLDDLRLILERKWLETFHNVSEVELYSCLAKIEHQKDNGAMTKRTLIFFSVLFTSFHVYLMYVIIPYIYTLRI